MGAIWFEEGVFGHGAASAATLHIDAGRDMVTVMTRNTAGAHFQDYHPQFMAAVREHVIEEK